MFYDVFKELCEAKKISCKAAAMEMGFSNSTASKWKRTKATPNGDTLNRVADYFGVSVSYLLSRQGDDVLDNEKAPTAGESSERNAVLTEGEEAMLALFRRVPADKQKLVIEMIRAALSTKE